MEYSGPQKDMALAGPPYEVNISGPQQEIVPAGLPYEVKWKRMVPRFEIIRVLHSKALSCWQAACLRFATCACWEMILGWDASLKFSFQACRCSMQTPKVELFLVALKQLRLLRQARHPATNRYMSPQLVQLRIWQYNWARGWKRGCKHGWKHNGKHGWKCN